MYYEIEDGEHGLPFNPFKACIVPRPIAWISTLSPKNIPNLAPFSISNQLAYDPPFVFFSGSKVEDGVGRSPRSKDSVANAETTGEFVWNMATYDLRHQVRDSSTPYAPDVDEFREIGLTPVESRLVKPFRVLESPISLECKYHASVCLPASRPVTMHQVVIGRVVAIHIADWALREGRIDFEKIKPLARLGYMDFTYVKEAFELPAAAGLAAGMVGQRDSDR